MSAEAITWAFAQEEVKGNDLLTLIVIADGSCGFSEIQEQTHATYAEALASVHGLLQGQYIVAIGGRYFPALPPRVHQQPLRAARPRKQVGTRKALRVFERDGYACLNCGETEDLTIDHIVPVAHGGTNDVGNLQTLCGRCNSSKGTRPAPAVPGALTPSEERA